MPANKPTNRESHWESSPSASADELFRDVAIEGANRLLFDPTDDAREQTFQALAGVIGQKRADSLGEDVFDYAVEAFELGVQLGAALVQVSWVGDNEAWLQRAIAYAELGDYRPHTKFTAPA